MSNDIIRYDMEEYIEYMRDESRITGKADSISFPTNEAELKRVLEKLAESTEAITVQGARTGLTGGAVPMQGHVINLSKMNRITGLRFDSDKDCYFLRVEPGVLLSEVNAAISKLEFDTSAWSAESLEALKLLKASKSRFFSPDPTETSATIGGMVSCNASGAKSFKYGATRNHIESLRIVLADGDTVSLKRGRERIEGGVLRLTTQGGREICEKLDVYNMPHVKNASGYYLESDMDAIDLFVGSEGTLGITVEAEIALIPKPGCIYGVMAFFPDQEKAIDFVESAKALESKPAAIEFFNCMALELIRANMYRGHLPDIQRVDPVCHTGIYVELHSIDEDTGKSMLKALSALIEGCGGNLAETWLAISKHDMERLKEFRHAVPEFVNSIIDERRKSEPTLTKLGTDMAVPNGLLRDVMKMYDEGIQNAGLESVIFGHIGDNHLHVNILPRNMAEYDTGKKLYGEWAQAVAGMGGTVSAEHGIGKFKVGMLRKMYSQDSLDSMMKIKRIFDPGNRLNRGNLFG